MDIFALVQAVIALLVITAPPDPAKILLFNKMIEEANLPRSKSAIKVALIVAAILGGAALGGAQIAKLMGIDLNAFSVVGGIVVAGMGFEMLYGGAVSKTQGQQQIQKDAPGEGDGLVMPLSIPLIAGPGAIVTCVTISSSSAHGMLAALAGVASVAALTFVSLNWLGGFLASVPARTTALLLRIGGMLLATIGMQMLLGGLKKFFEAT